MAFIRKNLTPVGGQSSRGHAPQVWGYETVDTLATVDTSGYFNNVSDVLTIGDLIYAHASTGGTREYGLLTVVSNASGVVDVSDAEIITGAGAPYALTVFIADISTADEVYIVPPIAGTVITIWSVIDGAIATADALLTSKIGGTAITGGVITVANSGSAAEDVDSATPTALNVVAVGDALEIETNGASTNTVKVSITYLIQPSVVDTD